MKLEVRSRGYKLSEALQLHIERRIEFAIDRFAHRVSSVTARVTCRKNGRTNQDQLCTLEVHLIPFGTVVIEERNADLYTAVDRAADRLGAGMARLLKRAQPDRSKSIRHPHEAPSAA